MFVKATAFACDGEDRNILLNINHIIAIKELVEDDEISVQITKNNACYVECRVKITDMLKALENNASKNVVLEWLAEEGYSVEELPSIEPETLSEICDVKFEYGRVTLTVNKGMIPASRKFGLLDQYEKYEFDGGTMYFFTPGSCISSFSISCGNGSSTCVDNATKKCRKAVKQEIAQCVEKKIAIPSDIAYDLSRNTDYAMGDFEVIGKGNE